MIVYRYGLRAPKGHRPPKPLDAPTDRCACAVCQQLIKAHRYANVLTEIERGRRAALRELHRKFGDTGALEQAVSDAEQACERILDDIKRARARIFNEATKKGDAPGAAKRGARVTPLDLAAALADARARKREAVDKLAEHRRVIRDAPEVIVGQSEIENRAKELQRSAREHSDVYWGTYLMIERAHGASVASLPLYDGAKPNDPRFDRYRDEGSLSVQLQSQKDRPAFTVERLFGDDSRVQLVESAMSHTRLKRDERGRIVRAGPIVEVRQGNRIVRRQEPVREMVEAADMRHRTVLRLRIGSAGPAGREPLWAEWPVRLERPLPKGAIVSWVTVTKRMIGLREEWSVQFTLETVGKAIVAGLLAADVFPDAKEKDIADFLEQIRAIGLDAVAPGHALPAGWRKLNPSDERLVTLRETLTSDDDKRLTRAVDRDVLIEPRTLDSECAVAVNLGWRAIDDALRVVAWRSKDGRHGDFRLPPSLLAILREADEVRGRRDKEFDRARLALAEWLAASDAPPWLCAATKSVAAWKSPARLVALIRRWHFQRFAGDEAVFAALEAWRYHEHHLWLWETSVRATAHRSRDDLYRQWAKFLSESFDVLVLAGDFDVRKVARRPRIDGEAHKPAASANRQIAAPGRLRAILVQAFAKRMGAVAKPSGTNMTRTCQVCGLVEEFDAARNVMRAEPCSGCGSVWDQDDNANIETLARYDRERERDKQTHGVARNDEKPKKNVAKEATRWERNKLRQAAKFERVATARKILENRAKEQGNGETPAKGSATP